MKRFILLTIAVFIAFWNFNAQTKTLEIHKVITPPKIDGILNINDNWIETDWVQMSEVVDVSRYGEIPTSAMSARFQLKFDNDNLYLAVFVNDGTRNVGFGDVWRNDCIEAYIDLDTTVGDTKYKTGTWQIRKQASVLSELTGNVGVFSNFSVINTDDGNSYVQEWALPWSELSMGMDDPNIWKTNMCIHFDISAADATTEGDRTQLSFWNDNSDLQWNNTSHFGLVKLGTSDPVDNRQSQTITFTSLAKGTVGDADVSLTGSASSGLAVTYTSSDIKVATIVSGNKLHFVGAGTCNIIASQAGNSTYKPATSVSQPIVVSSKSVNAGLVAYYPFNGNANDESGNGNNGTVNGASFASDRFGKNNAFSFNGTDNYIQLPLLTNLNNQSKISCAFWVQTDFKFSGKYGAVFGHWNKTAGSGAGNVGFEIILPNDTTRFKGAICSSMSAGLSDWTDNDLLQPNKWQHVTLVYDGTQSELLKRNAIYIDGVFKGYFGDSSIPAMSGNTANMSIIGAQVANPIFNYFKGKLDDIYFYNKVLSESEIIALATDKPIDINSGLVAYYPFNGNANDESGQGNNGTVNGASLTNDMKGNFYSAYSFNGTSNFIKIANTFDYKEATYSLWVNAHSFPVWNELDPAGSYKSVLCSDNPNLQHGGFAINVTYKDGVNKLYIGVGSIVVCETPILKDSWNYVTLTRNDSVGKVYLNGVLISSKQINILTSNQGNAFTYIGTSRLESNRFFDGFIDDVRIYNRALESSEALSLYSKAVGKPQTIEFTTIPALTYGAKDVAPIAKASSGLPITYLLSDSSVVELVNGKLHIRKTGNTVITAMQAGNDTLAPVLKSQTIVVKPAPLYVTTINRETYCGQAIPAFSIAYFGFVNGDDEADISTKPLATCKANQTSAPGEYTIAISGGKAANYSFVYVNGALKILPLKSSVREVAVCKDSTFKLPSGKLVTKAGNYTDSLKTKYGCDSLAIFNILFVSPLEMKKDVQICEGKSYIAEGASQTKSGIYHDTVVSSVGCDSIYITTNLKVEPKAKVSGGTDATICSGDSVRLAATGTGKLVWQSFTSNTILVKPLKTTIYKAISSTACGNAYDDVTITVLPKPLKPDIYLNGNTLFVNTSEVVNWYLNNGLITNENDWKYIAKTSGLYYAQVVNEACSSEPSATIDFKLVSTEVLAKLLVSSFELYPNPAVNELKIRTATEWTKVEVYNLLGTLVLSSKNSHAFETAIDVHKLNTGTYYAKIYTRQSSSGALVKPFVKR